MATHSSILARRILWTEEPGRLQSMGSQRVIHDACREEHVERTHACREEITWKSIALLGFPRWKFGRSILSPHGFPPLRTLFMSSFVREVEVTGDSCCT